MLPFLSFTISSICVLLPVILVFFLVFSYNLAIGNISIAGIARGKKDEKKHWSSATELTRKASEFLALTVSVIGSIVAFIGFLNPWVTVSVSNAYDLGLTALNGNLTGIGLIIRSILGSYHVLGTDIDGTIFVGVFLFMVALYILLIFFALLVSAISGVGIVAIPLGYSIRETSQLLRQSVRFGLVAFFLCGIFCAVVQAVSNGIDISSTSDLFDFSLTATVNFANGFWYTIWGLLFTIISASVSKRLLGRYVSWIENLTKLEQDKIEKLE